MVWQDGWVWKEHDLKIDDKHVWEKGKWTDLSKWAQNVKICVSSVDVRQMVETLDENFNNQVYKMTHLFLSFRNERTSHEDREGNYAWVQQRELTLTKFELATVIIEPSICKE